MHMELEVEFFDQSKFVIRDFRSHRVELQLLAKSVCRKIDFVYFCRQEETGVAEVRDLVRMRLKQRLVKVKSLEKGHGCRDQVGVRDPSYVLPQAVDVAG